MVSALSIAIARKRRTVMRTDRASHSSRATALLARLRDHPTSIPPTAPDGGRETICDLRSIYSPSSGSVPAGLPSRDRRIFSTLSSADLRSASQWAFSASPRS